MVNVLDAASCKLSRAAQPLYSTCRSHKPALRPRLNRTPAFHLTSSCHIKRNYKNLNATSNFQPQPSLKQPVAEEDEECEEWEDECDEYEEDGEYDEEWEEDLEEDASGALEASQEEQYVDVGLITMCHGVRGEVKVQPLTDSPKRRFGRKGAKVWVQPPSRRGLLAAKRTQQQMQQMTVESARAVAFKGDQQAWIVKFIGINTREQAEQLQKHRLQVATSEREALRDPDEFYVQDLVGLGVVLQQGGQLLGSVVDVLSGMGSHDSLKVVLTPTEQDKELQQQRICYIPFVKDICPGVDLKQRLIEVTPPEGLLDVVSVVSTRRGARGRGSSSRPKGKPAAQKGKDS